MVGSDSVDSLVLFATHENPSVAHVCALYVTTSERQFLWANYHHAWTQAALLLKKGIDEARSEYSTEHSVQKAEVVPVFVFPLEGPAIDDIYMLDLPLHFAGSSSTSDGCQELIQRSLDAYLVQAGLRYDIDHFAQITVDIAEFDKALRAPHLGIHPFSMAACDVNAKARGMGTWEVVPKRSSEVVRAETAYARRMMGEPEYKASLEHTMAAALEGLRSQREQGK